MRLKSGDLRMDPLDLVDLRVFQRDHINILPKNNSTRVKLLHIFRKLPYLCKHAKSAMILVGSWNPKIQQPSFHIFPCHFCVGSKRPQLFNDDKKLLNLPKLFVDFHGPGLEFHGMFPVEFSCQGVFLLDLGCLWNLWGGGGSSGSTTKVGECLVLCWTSSTTSQGGGLGGQILC